jgi:hypothetical protein
VVAWLFSCSRRVATPLLTLAVEASGLAIRNVDSDHGGGGRGDGRLMYVIGDRLVVLPTGP